MKPIYLLTQGDDFASTEAATMAIMEAHERGILRNASVMVNCPYFEEAARSYANTTSLCFGLHGVMNSEWSNIRWGPVTPSEEVPSIVDDRGNFLETPMELYRRRPVLGEIMVELKNQLAKARNAGFDIKYVDTHMRFEWIREDLTASIEEWCKEEDLIFYKPYERFLPFDESIKDPIDRLKNALHSELNGQYLLIGHPAYDIAEMHNLDVNGSQIARERNLERLMFMDNVVIERMRELSILPIRYDELERLR